MEKFPLQTVRRDAGRSLKRNFIWKKCSLRCEGPHVPPSPAFPHVSQMAHAPWVSKPLLFPPNARDTYNRYIGIYVQTPDSVGT